MTVHAEWQVHRGLGVSGIVATVDATLEEWLMITMLHAGANINRAPAKPAWWSRRTAAARMRRVTNVMRGSQPTNHKTPDFPSVCKFLCLLWMTPHKHNRKHNRKPVLVGAKCLRI